MPYSGNTLQQLGSWDWTRGNAPALLADWPDANSVDATTALGTRDQVLGGDAIRMVPPGTAFEGGVVKSVSGAFTWAFRFGLINSNQFGFNNSGDNNSILGALYMDTASATVVGQGYGAAIDVDGYSWETHRWGGYSWSSGMDTVVGSVSELGGSDGGRVTWARSSMIDVWLDYDGSNVLEAWTAPAGEIPMKVAQLTGLTDGQGYLGVYLGNGADNNMRALLLHAVSVGSVPGFE